MKNRESHIQNIKSVLSTKYPVDSWGNYKINDTTRWHFAKNSLKKQSKIDGRWANIISVYYKDVVIVDGKVKFKKVI